MKTKITMLLMFMFIAIIFSGTASATYTGTNASNYTVFSNQSINANDIATDSQGNIYVTGTTSNAAYTTTNGTYTTKNNTTTASNDAYIAKYSSNGTLIFSTVIGGTGSETGNGISVDKNGNIYIIGQTTSTDLPVTSNAYQTTLNGNTDSYIIELSADGTKLLYCTYLGGSGSYPGGNAETGNKIKVDSNGNIYVIGQTKATDFPTNTTAFEPNGNSIYMKCFVAKFDSNWNKVYSSYLAGNGGDYPYQLVIDNNGNAWIVGKTTSSDFPVTSNAYQKSAASQYSEAFLCEISADGSQLLYSTYFGGSSNEYGYAIASDSNGNIYILGQTTSTNLPVTSNAYQTTRNGNADAFVAKFDSTGSLLYSTYFGGSGVDNPRGIAVDSQGNVYIVGQIYTIPIPTTSNAIQTDLIGSYDAFVAKLSADGSTLLYGSLLGTTGSDCGNGVVVDNESNVYVVGTGGFALTKIATAPTAIADPLGGLFNTTQTVTLTAIDSTGTLSGTIYYTTDGTDPTNSTTRTTYTEPITINTTTTLRYAVIDDLGNWSPIYNQTYTIDTTAPTVTVNSIGGLFNTTQTVTITTDDTNSTIYYTTDGTDPTNSTTRTTYTGPITINSTTTLRYTAEDTARNWATTQKQTYTIDKTAPTASVNVKSGTYNTNKTITLSISENGTIYYTTDGTTPTTNSKKYTGPITISKTTTLRYIAVDLAGNTSPVYTNKYAIDKTALKVTSTNPTSNKNKVSRKSSIIINFNKKIKLLNKYWWSKIVVKNQYGKVIPISKYISGNKLIIKTSTKQAYTHYTITIPAAAISDYAGNKLKKAYKLTFETGK